LTYFSATGNTAKIAAVIQSTLEAKGATVDVLDITHPATREEKPAANDYQAFIFGFPVHSDRAPRVAREWLKTLDGKGRKCSTFFTYGGFGILPAHGTTRDILEGRNFDVVSSAEFPAAHSFNIGGWNALEDRPGPSEFDLAGAYAIKTYDRFCCDKDGKSLELPETEP
jgi:flavodoxin